MIDIPNERSSHVSPTPRGGGLAIVITWYIGITILFYFNIIERNLYYALLCGLLLAFISLMDDLINLKPIIRLIVQVLTAGGALFFLKGINSVHIGGFYFDYNIVLLPIAIIGIVWFINLYNFLDGIDGYASIEAIMVAIGLYLFTGNLVLLILISSVIGFLFWNWPKAKIFMGDVGSTQLGFILIILGIYFHNSQQFTIIHWLILTSPFWFDATLTLFRRWRNKEKLSQAHKKHAYQRMVQAGFSHLKTDIYLIGINLILITLLVVVTEYSVLLLPVFISVIIFLYWITRQIDKRKTF
jgi:Fuc2NAc and GlcNAc transferase